MIGISLKAKYIKRTGSPGKYVYTYREGGKKPSGKKWSEPKKKYKKDPDKGDRELTYDDLSPTAKEGFNIFGAMSSKEMIATGKKYEKETGKQFGRNDQKESFNKWVAENYSDSKKLRKK